MSEEPKYTTFAKGFSVNCDPKDAANVLNMVITGYPLAGHSEDVEFTVYYDSPEYQKSSIFRRYINATKNLPAVKQRGQYNLTKNKLSMAISEAK